MYFPLFHVLSKKPKSYIALIIFTQRKKENWKYWNQCLVIILIILIFYVDWFLYEYNNYCLISSTHGSTKIEYGFRSLFCLHWWELWRTAHFQEWSFHGNPDKAKQNNSSRPTRKKKKSPLCFLFPILCPLNSSASWHCPYSLGIPVWNLYIALCLSEICKIGFSEYDYKVISWVSSNPEGFFFF